MLGTKEKGYVALSVRIDKEDNRRFSALLALNETNAAEFFRGAVKDYIKQYDHLLALKPSETRSKNTGK
jgi:hypothetical protein